MKKLLKQNPMIMTERQLKWALNQDHFLGFYLIHPRNFISLTTSGNHEAEFMIEGSPRTLTKKQYESQEIREDWVHMPHLTIDETGKIHGHEGRHRAAASFRAGEKLYAIALIQRKGAKRMTLPSHLVGQYREEIQFPLVTDLFIPILRNEEHRENPRKKEFDPFGLDF